MSCLVRAWSTSPLEREWSISPVEEGNVLFEIGQSALLEKGNALFEIGPVQKGDLLFSSGLVNQPC